MTFRIETFQLLLSMKSQLNVNSKGTGIHFQNKNSSKRKKAVNAVLKAISRLKSKKSFGLDGISSYILKIAGSVVSKGLANIFNISISTGTFPDSWKIARVAPIFKEGSKSEIGNYRPISILQGYLRGLSMINCHLIWKRINIFQSTNLDLESFIRL